MILDEAIEYAKEKANDIHTNSAVEYHQLAYWLEELKQHRASFSNSSTTTVRELIFKLLELDIDAKDYYISSWKGYSDEN